MKKPIKGKRGQRGLRILKNTEVDRQRRDHVLLATRDIAAQQGIRYATSTPTHPSTVIGPEDIVHRRIGMLTM